MGTKLEHIIICLADEIEEKEKEQEHVQNKPEDTVEKAPWVKPSDKHFWFGRPGIFLYMIHFILFQNSFEFAFFLWVLVSSKQQVTCTVLMESLTLLTVAYFLLSSLHMVSIHVSLKK